MIQTQPRTLPKELHRAQEVRAMDRYAIDILGIPGLELMRRAGAAAFAALCERWPTARTLSAICGAGNNGGDAYVVARLAHEAGWDVRVYPVAPLAGLKGDALAAYQEYRTAGGAVLDFIPADFEGAEILVDGLFGTGLDREVEGLFAEVIRAVNRFRGKVLALDIPSGLCADTGAALGVAVRAAVTVSFIGLKQGLCTGEGLEYAGELVFADLETPPMVKHAVKPSALLLPPLAQGLPPRPRYAHKGHFGHVLVLGGEQGYSGAARLAAEAAARVGAGLVSLGTRPQHAAFLNLDRPELMCHGVTRRDEAQDLLGRATVAAVGPGLGRSDWAALLLDAAIDSGLPLVVDADALNLLAAQPRRCERWVLTPHPGEAGRLLGTGTAAVQRDRYAAARALQDRYGGVVVLKGSGTLIVGADELPRVCIAGNPGMASGGMGDVLTGVVAGLLAQGLEPLEAATLGVRLHAAAGDEAARDGERGLLAGDLMAPLRRWVNR
ncbi:NAD(P)H-hydrate epimerase [Methylomagnum ishizawai]|uniref:Bifunctional NAD(P)H-hydrate repair enzyme n=1 Tax=Methylomagnum ishizawai TaxID=1760988 RepID=A0A1Y6CW07_9GAMM|nr:NAD(P)H-hydrate dehydratase [Methylomagnum ishizawai]SMF94849.1 NAD(P)H-hydrate epimerase [Methylomagnum ishizawai]